MALTAFPSPFVLRPAAAYLLPLAPMNDGIVSKVTAMTANQICMTADDNDDTFAEAHDGR